MIANLPANARVQLFAVSNEIEALTDGYVAVDSKELGDAVASLKTRAPLGATDLEKAFTVAADSFDYNENADRSIVFVGRGVSAGAAFNEDVFGETVEKLVDARVPVNAFGVGTTVNEDVLGALANITEEYATKRYRSNLINWGMLPLLIEEGELPFANGDWILLPDIRAAVREKRDKIMGFVVRETELKQIWMTLGELTGHERQIILDGCLINFNREMSRKAEEGKD
jgi:hypothetical protein